MAETIREIAERLAGPHDEDCGVGSGFCVCGDHRRRERVQAIEEALRARDEARDAEWCRVVWSADPRPDTEEPLTPQTAAPLIRQSVAGLRHQARRQGREEMREDAASLADAWGGEWKAIGRAIRALPLDEEEGR